MSGDLVMEPTINDIVKNEREREMNESTELLELISSIVDNQNQSAQDKLEDLRELVRLKTEEESK